MGTWVLSRSQINLCTSLGLVPETTWPANRVVKIGTKGAKPFYLWTRGGVYVELRTLVNRWVFQVFSGASPLGYRDLYREGIVGNERLLFGHESRTIHNCAATRHDHHHHQHSSGNESAEGDGVLHC